MKSIEKYIEDLSKNPQSLPQRIDRYSNCWLEIYYPSQEKKWKENNLSPREIENSIDSLLTRANLLLDIFEECGAKIFAEVGTAEGFQSYLIADYLGWDNSVLSSYTREAFSCDIRDVRNNLLKDLPPSDFTFVLGDSSDLKERLKKENKKVDLFWIDGSHDKWAVIYDVINLAQVQSPGAIWVFDDFDSRFGCYEEMNFLANKIGKFARRLELGTTGSGQPNTLLIMGGV